MKKWLKETWPGRVYRHWHDNAVFGWQHRRVRHAVARAFAATEPLALHRAIAVGGSWPDAQDERPLLFAACDAAYFRRFARYLAISSIVRSPGTRVHLHVYEPADDAIAEIEALNVRWPGRLTVSHEPAARNPYAGPSKFYFAAARFAISARLRETTAAPIMMIDADGLVVRDLLPGFAAFADAEAGFIHQSGSVAPYRQILASAIYLGRDGADFFTRLADAIGLALRDRGRYHVDQIAIHYALEYCAAHGRRIHEQDVDMRWSDSDFAPDALIWSTRGPRKVRFEELLATFKDLDVAG
ncbi:hypothetical protein G7078_07715 [Sphingomonas sinipercae]|uniref:Glycosyl transferase n=1 Tax=Sphingomonas sinipercae TaxID=2714944 RepID=A0A6G7ZP25_9SPHN|nr:hypothetical protein [Sphingomonas sinipercae]QIL02678.1 hypothetical protein G7078_07715 [Sphingomonas sinipercae]